MTETQFKDYEVQFDATETKIRKTQIDGEQRYSKYIMHTKNHENIDRITIKLREYYHQEEPENIDGVEFNSESSEPEPVKAEDIPEVVKKIQKKMNEEGEVTLHATATCATDDDGSNWFINNENLKTLQII